MTLPKDLEEGIFNAFSWLGIDNDNNGDGDDKSKQILDIYTMH